MRIAIKIIIIILLLVTILFADFYIVQITKISNNLYYDKKQKLYIVTEYCNENCTNKIAILQYDKNSYINCLIFDEYNKYLVKDIYIDK